VAQYDVLTHGIELEASSSVVAVTSSVIREHGQVACAEDGTPVAVSCLVSQLQSDTRSTCLTYEAAPHRRVGASTIVCRPHS
jgi:hypothetical protein